MSVKVRDDEYMREYYFAEDFENASKEDRTVNLKWDTDHYDVISHEVDFEGKMQVTIKAGESVQWVARYKNRRHRFSWGLYQLWW